LLNIDNRISPLPNGVTQVNPSVTVHLPNFSKQQLIRAKFYVDSASSVGNQSAKFQ